MRRSAALLRVSIEPKSAGGEATMRIRASFALGALASLAAATALAQPKSLKKMAIPADTPPDIRAQIERLSDKDPAARADAVMKLGGMGLKAAAALPFLVETARDETKVPINGESQSINAIVSESLKEIDRPCSIPLLIRLLDEKRGRNRALTVRGVRGDTRAMPRPPSPGAPSRTRAPSTRSSSA